MKNLGYKLQVTKKERIAIITSEALRRMQLEPSFPLKSLPALCFQWISIVAEPYLPHLEYLVQLLSPANQQKGYYVYLALVYWDGYDIKCVCAYRANRRLLFGSLR